MFKQATTTRVAAFFADGLEECEALVVCDLLYRSGIPHTAAASMAQVARAPRLARWASSPSTQSAMTNQMIGSSASTNIRSS